MFTYYTVLPLANIIFGHTGDLSARLKVHNSDRSQGYTRLYKPWTLNWSIPMVSRSKAMAVEAYLKKKPENL